jgi:hypothetical protein
MPSAVIDVLYAYNKFGKLDIPLNKLFTDEIIGDLNEWFESKKYSSAEIGAHLAGKSKAEIFAADVLNENPEVTNKLKPAFEKDSILHDWTPAANESIYLYHHKNDETVPVATTEALKTFLNEKGINDSTLTVEIDDKTQPSSYGYHSAGIQSFLIAVQSQATALLQ